MKINLEHIFVVFVILSIMSLSSLFNWLETKVESALTKIGITNRKMKKVYEISSQYSEMGVHLPHVLLIEPHFFSGETKKYLRIKVVFEGIKVISYLILPTGFMIIV